MTQIFLSRFRSINGIKQKDLADLLGTSTSFLSLVESGKSKLPDPKIDVILEEARKQNWDISEFIPSFYRLVFADKVLTSTLESPEEYALDWTTGGNSFGISNGDVLDIKHGKKEIDDSIASLIQKATGLNYEWLISGDGEEFDHYTEIYFDENKTIEEQILERLDHICIWIQSIDGRLHVLEDRIKRMDRKLAK